MTAPSTQTRSLKDLEWDEVKQAIARFALSDLGRERALDLSPSIDEETARTRLDVVREVLRLQKEGANVPAGLVRDCRLAAETLKRHAVISAGELREIARLLTLSIELDRFGAQHMETAPLLSRVLTIDPGLSSMKSRLHDVVDDKGEIRDDASVGLAAARGSVRSLRAQMKKRLEEVIGRYREALQDGYFAEREGRYVLPVRADAPFRVEGLVLDTSSSGSTLYVEPKELGQLGNKIRLAEAEVEREEALVLAQVSAELTPFAEEMIWAQDVAVRADLLRSVAEFSGQVGAKALPFAEPGVLELKEARHPLLCLQADLEVVPNDLSVAPDQGLVLSGPNAGGKTVALKTLGLLAIMQATGLPVPAHEESRIGFFDEVLCDIGDDQSLSMSLSSFSGHVQRVKEIIEEAGHGTLVLFDELMSGTDPDEGAVLAIATVDELVASGSAVVVTTHYEPLKEHAATSEVLINGAVGFDFDKMGPTFRVEMGRPGASSAIIVAERHGLPTSITQRAVELMPEVAAKKREQAIELEEKSVAADEERESLHKARVEQESINRRSELELERLREKRRNVLAEESDALRNEVRQARAELRALRQAMKTADAAALKKLDDQIGQASSVVSVGSRVDKQVRDQGQKSPGVDEKKLKVGQRVGIRGFDSGGEILDLPKKGKVRVLVGVMKMSVPVSDLLPMAAKNSGGKNSGGKNSGGKNSQKAARAPTTFETQVQHREPPIRSDDVTMDLRGERVETGLAQLDHFVDELLRRQEIGGFVLHGHGTGAMKEAVRQHLRGHFCISESRPAERDEGGDAFTIFWLSAG